MRLHRTPFCCTTICCAPSGCLLLPLPESFARRYHCALVARYNRRRAALEGESTVSEQANYRTDEAFGLRLVNHAYSTVLPVGAHAFSEAINRCVLVDKTMFIADMLDCETSVALCCRPKGFGKSMNLSMLKCYLERPAHRRAGRNVFVGTQIWEAGGGRYRDEYARYPVITLDFSAAAKRGIDASTTMRGVLERECVRLLPLLDVPDLPRSELRHVERVARGVADDAEIDSVLGVLIALLETSCDEQVVLLVDEYDAALPSHKEMKGRRDASCTEHLDRLLFDAIAHAGDSLRLICLMGERPVPAELALSQRGVSYRSSTPLSTWCDQRFGFSDDECQALLHLMKREDSLDDAREWLEGYRFGGFYCSSPERMMDFLRRGCTAPVRADLYSCADRLSACVDDWNLMRLSVLFDLLEPHGFIDASVHVHADGPDTSEPDDIWTALYLSGFLTTDMTEQPEDGARLRALRLPNNEVHQALRLVILEWFECAVEDVGAIDAFRDGLCRGNEGAVRQALSCVLSDLGLDANQSNIRTAYHLALQGLCFGLPGYCNPTSKRKGSPDCWYIQVIPARRVLDVADTLGMLDERPLITINMMYDPGVDALGLELLAVQALLEIERNGIDDIRVPRPAVGRMRWGFGFDGQHLSAVCQRL